MIAKTTKTNARKHTPRARFERAYRSATPAQRRAIETALVMLTSGASPELTQAVTVKLADMWSQKS